MTQAPANIRSTSRVLRYAAAIAKLALCAGAAGWILWVAVTRWDGRPALEYVAVSPGVSAGPPIEIELDRTDDLVAVFSAIPPAPALKLPSPPDGMRWTMPSRGTVAVDDVSSGEWTLDSRPHLRAAVEYILSPAVETALRKLSDIQPGGWRPDRLRGTGRPGLIGARRAAKILVARARYHFAARGDVEAALAELGVVYRLSEIVYDSGNLIGVLVAMSCDALADSELTRLSREHHFRSAEAALACTAARRSAFEFRDIWQHVVEARMGQLQWKLDTSYTNHGNGDGWLVLSYLDNTVDPRWAANRRCGAWNVFSPLFHGRKAVAGKIARLRSAYESAHSLPYKPARESIVAGESRTIFGVVDGPLAFGSMASGLSSTFRHVTRHLALRRAALTWIALSVYQAETGRYPPSLNDLVPDYLDEVPLDPVDDRPLRYTRDADGALMLYSIASNLLDDGGVRSTTDDRNRSRRDGDWILTRPRPEPMFESVLERIEP